MQVFQLHIVIDNHSLPGSIYCIFDVCVSYIVNIDVTVLKMVWSVLLKACAYFFVIYKYVIERVVSDSLYGINDGSSTSRH